MTVKPNAQQLLQIAVDALPTDGSEITWAEWGAAIEQVNPAGRAYMHEARRRGLVKATVAYDEEAQATSHTVRLNQEVE